MPCSVAGVYEESRAEVEAAWALVEAHIGALPPALAALGRRHLAAIGRGEPTHRGYFSGPLAPPLLYLPLWLAARFRREGRAAGDDPALHRILAAAMLGYFYIRIQDDVIDGARDADRALALYGNAALGEMLAQLRAAVGDAPDFWDAARRAWLDFSARTAEEHAQLRSDAPYPEALFVAHADKVAFARVPALAACALAGRMNLAGDVAALVHRLGVATGLVNDAIGWPRDLKTGQRTYLLARAGISQAQLAAPTDAVEEAARAALYDRSLLHDLLAEARAAWRKAGQFGAAIMGLPELRRLADERVHWLDGHDEQIALVRLQRALAATVPGSSVVP